MEVFRQLFEEMRITAAYAAVYEEGEKVWTKSFRYDDKGIDAEKLARLARQLMKESSEQIFLFEELESEKIKEIFREYNIAVLLPLIVKRELVGVVLLSDKGSGEVYSSRDIEVLKIVAPELAIGIKNASAYQQIQDFNTILTEEVRKATSELRGANKRLLELDARKDEFISIASHELRTPLTAIKNYLWVSINTPPKPLPEQVKKDLEVCYGSAEHMIHLVNDMLTVSRIESNRIDVQIKPMDIVDLLKTLDAEMKIQANNRKIDLMLETDTDKQLIDGDKDKLREVFQNIIGNALKFVPDGEGFVKVKLDVKRNHVQISVEDNGPGIRKEDREKLFSKFGKLDFAYNKAKSMSGTGLGLYISKRIVGLHSGSIDVESEVNKGATFIVILPINGERKKHI
jgi:signal transduction histidine kinase